MGNLSKLGMAIVLTAITASSAAFAGNFTRGANVVEGKVTKVYTANQYGNLLYTFDMDSATASACVQTCAEQWPPFIIGADEAKALAAPFGTITRHNGMLQLTIGGKPVYTYFLNRIEGDDKGDGVGGVWHDIDFK